MGLPISQLNVSFFFKFAHLAPIKLSFSNSFKQSIIFQKALARVTEINRPLHVAFHMLQTARAARGAMLKWGQTIVN